ncbi:MAG: hypothetical protein ACSLEY_04215 [Candidatus Saccharimonadales bacterium]
MAERLINNSGEHINSETLEHTSKAERERLASERGRNAEKGHRANAEQAKYEALEAINKTEKEKKEVHQESSPAEKRSHHRTNNTKAARNANFKREMKHVQSQMSVPSRAFSKLIHVAPVERASEAIGATIARPNAILLGSFFAALATLGLYLWARHDGYPLSGFETIGAFILGWLIGIIVDFTRIMITGKR